MRVALLTLASLSASCGLFQTPCPERVASLRAQLAALDATAAEVDPWALPDAPPGPVAPARLATVSLPYAPSEATRAAAIDAAGQRYLDGKAMPPERSALCAALGRAPLEGLPPVRLHADADARATDVVELLADLHSCSVYRIDLVFARQVQPAVERSAALPPADLEDCPVDRASVAYAAPADRPARLAEALLSAQEACGCPLSDDEVIAAWQASSLPSTFVTSLAVRPSPSATPFEVGDIVSWQDATARLVDLAGPDPLAHPVLLWFANAGSLVPADDTKLPLPPPP